MGLGVKRNRYYTSRREGYFFDFVKQELIDKYGLDTVRRGGLRIDTTIDLRLQRLARKTMDGNLGDPNRSIAIRKVTFPDGHVDDLGKPRKHRAFSDGVTYEATKILEQNVKSGTGFPNATQIGCPAAGKTGTTDNFTDAWFVGFTPRLATAVWLGHATSRVPMPGITGGTIPAKIWGQYMKVARGGFCGEFPKPTVPFQPAPFFGKYATGGGSGAPTTPDGGSASTPGATGPATSTGGTGTGTTTDSTGGQKYPPSQYESPPQTAPATKTPPGQAKKGAGNGGVA